MKKNMAKIDKGRIFKPVNIAVMTISDTRSLDNDVSGVTLIDRIESSGHKCLGHVIERDEVSLITASLKKFIDDSEIDVVITTGGTGLTGRDVTPEAFENICDKIIPGFGEIFRLISFNKIGASTIQSRALSGIANGKYLFALPGSPSACKDAWDEILSFQLDYRFRPCNLVELMPRLKEV